MSYRILIILSMPYFAVVILWQFLGLHLGFPAVDSFIDISYLTAPFHVAMAIGGSALILIIGKVLQKSRFLNLFGRQSLFIYLTHSLVVCALMSIWKIQLGIPCTIFEGIGFYISIYIVSIVILSLGCKMMNSKYLCWMVGRTGK